MNVEDVRKIAKKHFFIKTNGKNPQILIVGESHDIKSLMLEEEFIKLTKPKIILHEGAKREYLNHPKLKKEKNILKDYFLG